MSRAGYVNTTLRTETASKLLQIGEEELRPLGQTVSVPAVIKFLIENYSKEKENVSDSKN